MMVSFVKIDLLFGNSCLVASNDILIGIRLIWTAPCEGPANGELVMNSE
jgi:hypothetical protein